ncbi:MAG: penicillin-binding protein 1C [Azospirillum sp.]|nr:penicillin-binding protein 1C [Azospirillum sp.]
MGAGLVLAGAAWGLDRLFPPRLDRLSDLSVEVLDRDGQALRRFLNSEDSWRLPATADDVTPLYLDLLLTYEDRRFYRHWGVDPRAVLRAIGQNIAGGRIVSGASTLTMQVARLLEPRPRSLGGKLIEMLRALQLEAHFDKRAILSMYLTLAPFGGNLEGVRAASLVLFGKTPRALTPAEAALLVALPQAPTRLRPERAPARALAARTKVLERAAAAGVIERRTVAEAAAEAIPTARRAMPAKAVHLADYLRGRATGGSVIRSTIDGPLQQAVEALARREAEALSAHAGLAVLVVDNRSRSVLAWVGGPDYLDDLRNGPIDMVRAVRSPGSALKPFIYGLGFDDRVIHPSTLVSDVSVRFGGYAPANFDRDFHGELTVREALQRSLNVPAVIVLDRVGPVRFAEALKRAGARLVFPPGLTQPGLPLALGGVSISLADLTMLYVGLARGGLIAPLVTEPETIPTLPVRLMSEHAAGEVLHILQGTAPPPGVIQIGRLRQGPAIAIKTGTSYGFRDAWCFGVTPRYTVGVWVGRPDGTPNPDHYGRDTAGPVVYRVFDLLPGEPVNSWIKERPAAAAAPSLLRRLEPGDPANRPIALADPDRLRLVFPTPGVVLELDGAPGHGVPLAFQASGGRRPLTWMVNGRPIASSAIRREVPWRPDGIGFTRVTVVDAEGRTASAEFELRGVPGPAGR